MATTQATLDTLCLEILREEAGTTSYPDTLLHSTQNYIQRVICSWKVEDPMTKQQIPKWPLPFLFTDYFYSTVQDVTLTAAATVWWTTLSLDTTNFSSTWKVWISWNIITYTWKTSSTLTWVTWILFAHASWTSVSQLLSLPSDFASSVQVVYNNQYQLFPQDYRTLFKELNKFKSWSNRYYNNITTTTWSIIDFSDNINPFYTIIQWDYLLPFNVNETGKSIWLMYEKIPATITNAVDATVPDEYAEYLIPMMTVAEILYNRWEENRADRLMNRSIGKLKQMYDFYSSQNNENPIWNRIKSDKDWGLNI